MDIKWTEDQVISVLRATLLRLHKNTSSFKIKTDLLNKSVTFSNFENIQSIYLTISEDSVYISIGAMSGSFKVSAWPWSHKEIKKISNELINIGKFKGESPDAFIAKAFPELADQEFERLFLEDKNGKKNK